MAKKSKTVIKSEIEAIQVRIDAYKAKELELLDPHSTQAYTIGSRNLQRYQLSLPELRKAIKELESEKAELEAQLTGGKRKAIGVVPLDN
jgi:archaellum component FlaC